MKTLPRREQTSYRRAAPLLIATAVVLGLTACSHAMMMFGGGVTRPAASEFGFGPRPSANGVYVATLEPARELKPRQMQTVRVAISDANGAAVDGATLTIDGGMPQHGHGLPTRPRMTKRITAGTYEIEGVRFNMGGWWEFKVTIASERGTDTVTFNLSL